MQSKLFYLNGFILLLLLSCNSNKKSITENKSANSEAHNSSIYTGWDKYNLQGKPKEIIFRYKRNYEINRENWSFYENGNEFWSHSLLNGRLVFDSLGLSTIIFRRINDSIGIPTHDFRNAEGYIYLYDFMDYKKKSKIEQRYSNRFPVKGPYGIRVSHKIITMWNTDTIPKVFDYIMDDRGFMIREDLYVHEDSLTDTLREGNNTFEQRIFSYDDKGRIVQEQFLPDEYLKEDGFMYKMQNRMRNDISLPAGETNLYTYAYDELDRITQTVLTINDFKVFQEDYAYQGDSQVPFKVNRFTLSTIKRYPTKNMELYYDNWGNLTKRIDVDEKGSPVRWRYYEYKYDEHNNWVQLNMFMEGTQEKTATPTLTVFREITYFN